MKPNMISFALVLCICSIFLFFPSTCFTGAKKGLELWFFTLIPSLYPFLVVTNTILLSELFLSLCKVLKPIFCPLFAVSENGCFPLLVGLLSGYPMGAKACADLVKENKISLSEGQYLLCFVNNPSPIFLLCYISQICLKCPQYCFYFYGILLLSACLVSFCYRLKYKTKKFSHPSQEQLYRTQPSARKVIDKAMRNASRTMTSIGGYIIFCSILTHTIQTAPHLSVALKIGILALIELSIGSHAICQFAFPLHIKIILTLTVASFGGLCSVLQTHSVIAESGLSIKKYIFAKLLQSLLVSILALGFTWKVLSL